jgi:uncharacterized repeat protein (TIGR03803 family)
MKILRIPLVIVLVVLAGRGFDAGAQTETNLHSFVGYPNDGSGPNGLVQGSDGNFYGTTLAGGTNDSGTVFRISPSGNYSNLYSCGSFTSDALRPDAGLVQGSDGNFYGTTEEGGTGTNCGGSGCGTVFRISPNGTETNLYSFGSVPNDGYYPNAPLVQGSDGNFYGTTQAGGSTNCAYGCGTVFRISPSGNYTNLYSFGSVSNDGENPDYAGLVQGSDGNFYGTTVYGGTHSDGTVFRISPSGSETNLHSFGSVPNDGSEPLAGLVQGSDGNFYGTTDGGGTNVCSCGTVFRISPSGSETNLHSFGSVPNDGHYPLAGLVQGSDGNFYGTTAYGGTINSGTVFRISLSGTYSNLYSFVGSPNDGAAPFAGLVQGSDGVFYGTTYYGGTNTNCYEGCGTVFKFSVPLSSPPYPINQITKMQKSGTNVVFNVVSIAYETYQLEFSSSLTPTNWSNITGAFVSNSIGALLTVTNFGGAVKPQGFYRFAITP